MPGVPRKPNYRKLAGTVTHIGYCRYPEDTFHAGILSLPPGCSLIVSAHDIKQRTYWTPEIHPELVPRQPAEIFEALRELLFEAVRCRLEEKAAVATELSGGLDSSAVTGIAAKILEERGQQLVALSAVLPEQRPDNLVDERRFIDEFRSWKNIRIEYITAPGKGPFDDIEDPHLFEQSPTIRFSRSYLYDCFESAAVASGAKIVFGGGYGELGPTCRGERYFVELAATLRWLTLFREVRLLRKRTGNGILRRIARQFLNLVPGSAGHPQPYVLLQPEFAKRGEALGAFRCPSLYQRDHQLSLIRHSLGGNIFHTGYTLRGHVRTSYPLADKRVLEFCLAAPPDVKVRDGYWRYLIRGSLSGVLPPKIQWRTDKVPFSPDYFRRYNAQLGKAREFVAAIRPGDPIRSVIDIPRLTQLMNPVPPGVRSQIARGVVPGTIYAICFLRQFAEFAP